MSPFTPTNSVTPLTCGDLRCAGQDSVFIQEHVTDVRSRCFASWRVTFGSRRSAVQREEASECGDMT